MHLFNLNDIVTICEDEINSSDDKELLESLIGQKLTIQALTHVDDELVHYTCSDESGDVIMYDEKYPFGFIDADLKLYQTT